YKFNVGADGLYRIPQSVLAGAGLGNVPAQNFQLFRNGQEVPIYTSVASGILGSSDYIEFWGQMNDGAADKPLYVNPAYQHTTKWSLETDTAAYFLTVNVTGAPFHFNNTTNDTTGNLLAPEPYFMYTTGTYYKSMINPGYAQYVGTNIYSSVYDMGEFWSSGYIYPYPSGSPALTDTKNNLYVYAPGPNASFRFGAVGCVDNARRYQALINGTVVADTVMNSFNDLVTSASIPLSLINSGTASVAFRNNCLVSSSDRAVASFYEINYPRQFNFNNQSNFYFELPAKVAGYYLTITNFNQGGALPVLYDLTNGSRYTAIGGSGNFYFILPGSASSRKLVMVSEDASNVNTITSLAARNFINYSNNANQGNYIIISNPVLYTGSSGNNPVTDYKNYRNSAAGGGFNAIVADINQLVDQFAYGIKKHPLSVRNFLTYARNFFVARPQYVFLIGRAVSYDQYRLNESNSIADALNLVPTFGFPASDNKLSSADVTKAVPLIPIGRLGAVNGIEVETYLKKVEEYENVQQTAPNTVSDRAWMKNVVHVTGASDPYLGEVLCNYMSNYQQIIQDTLFGANVTTFCKATPTTVDQIADQQITQLFSTGFSILNYFGHSSSSTLEYNLNDPSAYNNQGKYPVFYVNGCDAGNFFTYDPGRVLSSSKTLSETFVLANERGSIAFVASTSFGIVNYLNILLNGLYNLITNQDYGKSLGTTQADAMQNLVSVVPGDYYARLHAEQMTLHGDPALKLNTEALPDYAIEPSGVVISPSFISVADTSFTVSLHYYNLGKSVPDTIAIVVSRQYPDGSSTVLINKKIPAPMSADSITFSVPILPSRDKGQNYISVTLNANNTVQEVTTANNSVKVGAYIYVNEARPIYPYDYAIVTNPTQKLFASTADPNAPSLQYVMEMDTTEQFNSPLKVSKTLTSTGGLLEFDPGVSYRDSTVYYWRISIVPTQGNLYHWGEFSFVYLSNSSQGFNQSHYYQHQQSGMQTIFLDSASRTWNFVNINNTLGIHNGVFPTAASLATDFVVAINGNIDSILSVCGYGIVFNVFDPITFKPWFNAPNGQPGRYGSNPVCGPTRVYNFQYSFNDAGRAAAMNFMDAIPDGAFVVVRNVSGTTAATSTFASTWAGDTLSLGHGNSIYNRLLQQGFTGIDSFSFPRAFIFTYQKNRQLSFQPEFVFSQGIYDRISLTNSHYVTRDTIGVVTSPKFGPAKQWKQLHWRGSSLESPSTDSVNIQVIGIDTLGNATTLNTLGLANQDYDISSINAAQYPYLQLAMTAKDMVHTTPYQLQYWRLNYVPVPEGALAPNLYLVAKDTLQFGEPYQFAVAFKNVSVAAFDSMRINMTLLDHNNVTHVIQLPKKRPIISGDTLMVSYSVDTKSYPGQNTIFVDVNPDNDQPEQFHFNNFMYRNFYVGTDKTNPTLDVTFDGVHILNEDIVSAKPHVVIKLTSASKYLLLTDTSLMKVQVKYPDGTIHNFNFNTDTLRFTPATGGANNVATLDFYPAFTSQYNPQGDSYMLIVTGKDASGNTAGAIQYQISFTVITKPMISNMLNYPNPFTTSTAFVFTITGSEVPQNIKIQIMTITGKVVREITEDELGPLHVGRNITEFRWNGTDMYGQRLANGVYLYHVVTNLNGKSLDKYKSASDNTDQYFNKGYGKMYLMR
ncbi:MAG: hypothetical protein JST13_04330, partial [Bacteroidetes bacterium]|nr:hypothetical protein [Bacteroidota bacterium]